MIKLENFECSINFYLHTSTAVLDNFLLDLVLFEKWTIYKNKFIKFCVDIKNSIEVNNSKYFYSFNVIIVIELAQLSIASLNKTLFYLKFISS